MATVSGTLHYQNYVLRLDKFVGKMVDEMFLETEKLMVGFQRDYQKRRLTAASARSVGIRSGNLRRSFILKTKRYKRRIVSRVFFSAKAPGVSYSQAKLNKIVSVHEHGTRGAGGTLPSITPKRAQWLTVPLPAALTRSGVPRKKKARDWPNTFVFKSKSGHLFIAQRKGGKKASAKRRVAKAAVRRPSVRKKKVQVASGGLTLLYILKKSVDIRPRLHFRFDWLRYKKEKALPALRKKHKQLIRKWNQGAPGYGG